MPSSLSTTLPGFVSSGPLSGVSSRICSALFHYHVLFPQKVLGEAFESWFHCSYILHISGKILEKRKKKRGECNESRPIKEAEKVFVEKYKPSTGVGFTGWLVGNKVGSLGPKHSWPTLRTQPCWLLCDFGMSHLQSRGEAPTVPFTLGTTY